MKKLLFFFALFITIISCEQPASSSTKELQPADDRDATTTTSIDANFHDGDIIFQTSNSGQSLAIQLATHSKYSHCGLLFNDNGQWFVYEAVQPVKKTPVAEFIARGDDHAYVVRRLKNADSLLSPEKISAMRHAVKTRLGRNYDLAFNWSDENIYCSELVWKAYHESTGLEIGHTKPLGEYDLTNPIVKKKLEERYHGKIPKDEPIISPGSIFDSELLVTVKEN